MKSFFLVVFFVVTLQESAPVECLIRTSLGDITVELYDSKAPVTVKNFLHYVDQGLYDNSSFFRVCTPQNEAERKIQIEVIQGGNVPEEKCAPSIVLERTSETRIRHKNGVISMARDRPDSATSSFFICIGDQPELDFGGKRNPDGQGFAAFGRVTNGMDVVLKIQQQKEIDQYLVTPVKIISVRRMK